MSLIPDYTFLYQLIIFVMVWLALRAWLFKPVFKVLDERDKLLHQDRSEADELNTEADQWITQCEDRIRDSKVEGAQMRDEARQAALKEEHGMLVQAREGADQQMDSARSDLEQEVNQARTQIHEHVKRFSQEIVDRAIGEA